MSLIPTLFYSLLHLCFLIFSTGSGVAQKVTQDQPDITRQVEQSVTLNCQYEVSWHMISYYIFWYKQLPSGQMTYLIRQHSEDGNARDGRYSVNFQKADNSISLTVSALQLEDTAKSHVILYLSFYSNYHTIEIVILFLLSVPARSVVSDSLWTFDCSPPASSVHGILRTRIL